MDRSCLVENGGMRTPIGYRFRPTDEELVVHYLVPKALSLPFPSSLIPDLHVLQTDPSTLPGDLNEKRMHFFSNLGSGNNCRKLTGSGYWKRVGKCKVVVARRSDRPVGIRETLVFRRNGGGGARWFAHEFRFLGPKSTKDWAVYRLFQKKRKKKKKKKKKNSEEQIRIVL